MICICIFIFYCMYTHTHDVLFIVFKLYSIIFALCCFGERGKRVFLLFRKCPKQKPGRRDESGRKNQPPVGRVLRNDE